MDKFNSGLFMLEIFSGIVFIVLLFWFLRNKMKQPIHFRTTLLGYNMDYVDEITFYENGDQRIIDDYKMVPSQTRIEIKLQLEKYAASVFWWSDNNDLISTIKKIEIDKIYSIELKNLLLEFINRHNDALKAGMNPPSKQIILNKDFAQLRKKKSE